MNGNINAWLYVFVREEFMLIIKLNTALAKFLNISVKCVKSVQSKRTDSEVAEPLKTKKFNVS
jgi:hypothetical protein